MGHSVLVAGLVDAVVFAVEAEVPSPVARQPVVRRAGYRPDPQHHPETLAQLGD
jgi:hypothetical protein